MPRFFDSELVTSPEEWSRVWTGVVAAAVSSWMLLFALFLFKYKKVPAELVAAKRWNDTLSLTAMAVCLTGLLLAVLWQAVFPSLRDYLALAGLPVSGADIFQAKFVSLVFVYVVFAVVLLAPAAVVLSMTSGAAFAFGGFVAAVSLGGFSVAMWKGHLLLRGAVSGVLANAASV